MNMGCELDIPILLVVNKLHLSFLGNIISKHGDHIFYFDLFLNFFFRVSVFERSCQQSHDATKYILPSRRGRPALPLKIEVS